MSTILLFLMGIDLPAVYVILFIFTGFALGIFFLSRYALMKLFKHLSQKRIFLFSVLSVWVLVPMAFIVLFLVLVQLAPGQDSPIADDFLRHGDSAMTEEEYYEGFDGLYNALKRGMTKREVVELIGINDTTKNTLIYDFSLPDGKNKYVLTIEFENNEVVTFTKNQ
jgi:hypothetical protein